MAKGGNDDYNNMMCLDIFLTSLDGDAYKKIERHVKSRPVFPLRTWGVFGDPLKRQNDAQVTKDIAQIEKLSKKYNWNVEAASLLNKSYEALVVTDLSQQILWVSDGFEQMTGYDSAYAIGKTPKFLHGKNTSATSRTLIKTQLSKKRPFTEVITNYRKNKEEYLCEVSIIPIHNHQNEVTHFIALEKAV